jgi:hypothetical protein
MKQVKFGYNKLVGFLLHLGVSAVLLVLLYCTLHLPMAPIILLLSIGLCLLLMVFEAFVLLKWVIPAVNGNAAITANDNGLSFDNGRTFVPWHEIDYIQFKPRQFGNAIVFKLNELGMASIKGTKTNAVERLLRKIMGYHFSIPVLMLADDGDNVFALLNEYFFSYRA